MLVEIGYKNTIFGFQNMPQPVAKPCPYRLPLEALCCSAKHKE